MEIALVSALAQYEDLFLSRKQLTGYIRKYNNYEMSITERKKLLINSLHELKRFGDFIKVNPFY